MDASRTLTPCFLEYAERLTYALTLISADGFDTTSAIPNSLSIHTVTDKLGKDVANVKPMINDVAANLTSNNGNNTGFTIVMDEDKSSLLVSGTDGGIYLVGTKESYDLSSPWGTLDLKSGMLDLDAFGRIMSYAFYGNVPYVAKLSVWNPAEVPSKERAG